MRYEYDVFEIANGKRIHKGTVGANSIDAAIKKAGLDWLTAIKSRAGLGYTNAKVSLYDIWYDGRDKEPADYVMIRII